MDICFLIQLTDGGRRHLTAPQGLGDVLHTPDGYTCQVHLNESFFYTAFPAVVSLNDGGLKGDSFEFWHPQGDIPGSGGEISAIMAAAVALTLLIALVSGCLGQFLSLGLQQFIGRLLHAISYQLLQLTLYYFLV